jgi:hypothetical protein
MSRLRYDEPVYDYCEVGEGIAFHFALRSQ